jgi:hypothetical protein
MKASIETKAKEELGQPEYKRLLKLLFWLEEKLDIPSTANLDVVVIHDPEEDRIGSVSADNAQELKLMLNTYYYSDKENLNPVTGRFEDWFATAAHEMVHVKQWSTYQLTTAGSFYWEGKRFHSIVGSKLSYQEYTELPWEAEAFARQDELYQEWLAAGEPHSL